jgi:transcriptional regulator with XRE-family HTH domain
MKDLADYLQAEVDKVRSIRKVAKHIGISKTALENITKRKLKTRPQLLTLEKIADAYEDLTLPGVVEMAGAMMGDTERYKIIARKMEVHPWIAERFDDLTSVTQEQFNDWMDQVAWRRHRDQSPPDQDAGSPK